MLSEEQTIRQRESLSRLRRVFFLELSVWQLLVLAAAVGVLWAASFFDWSFVTGRHAFWQFPKGHLSDIDMELVLVGYLYYVQSPWHLPLFYVSALDPPAGTNVIFMDVVPIVALIGKLIHSLTGAIINLYGAYTFLCFVLPGVMITLVLIAAKICYTVAAIVAAIFANATPALLWRWGHLALLAHFLLIGALALYLFSLKKRAWRGLAMVWIAYLTLAYLTNIYLFAMVGTIWLCAIIQRRLTGLATTLGCLGAGALTIAVVSIVIALAGQFGAGAGLPFWQYGYWSMNLLSPIVPQESGLFPGLGGVIDPTGGQYEGFNYLGFGLVLASLIILPAEVSWLRRNLRRHVALFIAFATLAVFAISHRVFAGHWLVIELPLPHYTSSVVGIFRSSGRFFWPIAYAQMAIVIVLGFRRAQLLIAVCLVGAAILQLIDVQPLREQIIASIAKGPAAQELDVDQVAHLVGGARHVEVVPSFQCMDTETRHGQTGAPVSPAGPIPAQTLLRTNMELMLAAARANVPTNTVYSARETYGVTWRDVLRDPSSVRKMVSARQDEYCKQEIERARNGGSPGDVFVLLSDQPQRDEIVPNVICLPLSWARYCQKSDPRSN